jgi:peptidoglycan-associated lipoprotein
MKRSSLFGALVLGLAIAFSGTGCKHGVKGPTPIPGRQAVVGNPGKDGSGPTVPPGGEIPGGGNIAGKPINEPGTQDNTLKTSREGATEQGNIERYEGRPINKAVFQAYTVYFEFDSATILANEKSKIEAVADYMKKAPAENDLLVEGHCDERGTEEYNRALGERRALSIRERLISLGVTAIRIQTVSYGKDKPLDPEHNEAAWQKNRRGEFGLLLPKP